jgi:ATP-dependent Clp protease ATP-binding subunit ClpC
VFEHFTDHGRRVIVLAQEESRRLRHDHIGTEHLLLGLLHVEDDMTALALQRAGATLSSARRYVEKSQRRGDSEPSGHLPFTPRAKRVLELALRVSQRLDTHSIGEPELLRAMLDVPDCTAYAVLEGLGVDIHPLARAADDLARASQVDLGPGAPAERGAGPQPTAQVGRSRGVSLRTDYLLGSETHDQLVTRIAELGNAIRRFARHDESCDPDRGCSCGLQRVLDRLDPPE